MNHAIIMWKTEADLDAEKPGEVYGWYESLATALNTMTNMLQFGECFKAVVVKII